MYAREPAAVKRFEREARAMSRLAHPNCISVIDVGVDGAPYIVMDHISGRTLCDLLDEGPLRLRRILDIMRQILAGLAHAHSHSIVHRDIKPGNIMLSEVEGVENHVSILDFGLAKFRDNVLTQDITASATLVGTPGYMAPEMSEGEDATVQSDLYSVGVLLFEMLTQHKPYEADHPLSVLRMHREAPIPSVRAEARGRDIPRRLELVVKKALAKAPDDRFQSAAEFSRAIERVQRHLGGAPRKRKHVAAKVVAGAAVVAVGAVVVFALVGGDDNGHEAVASESSRVRDASESRGARVEATAPGEAVLDAAGGSVPTSVVGKDAATGADAGTVSALDAGSAAVAKPEPAKPTVIKRQGPVRLSDVRRLIARKQNPAAIRALLEMRKRDPKNAYLAYLVARLCMKQKMWGAAINHYRIAIGHKRAYQKNPAVIRDAIFVLSSLRSSDRRAARTLLVYTIGGYALRYLDRARRKSRSPRVRRYAAQVARQIRARHRHKHGRSTRRRHRHR